MHFYAFFKRKILKKNLIYYVQNQTFRIPEMIKRWTINLCMYRLFIRKKKVFWYWSNRNIFRIWDSWNKQKIFRRDKESFLMILEVWVIQNRYKRPLGQQQKNWGSAQQWRNRKTNLIERLSHFPDFFLCLLFIWSAKKNVIFMRDFSHSSNCLENTAWWTERLRDSPWKTLRSKQNTGWGIKILKRFCDICLIHTSFFVKFVDFTGWNK